MKRPSPAGAQTVRPGVGSRPVRALLGRGPHRPLVLGARGEGSKTLEPGTQNASLSALRLPPFVNHHSPIIIPGEGSTWVCTSPAAFRASGEVACHDTPLPSDLRQQGSFDCDVLDTVVEHLHSHAPRTRIPVVVGPSPEPQRTGPLKVRISAGPRHHFDRINDS
jgi:hypothetical protein